MVISSSTLDRAGVCNPRSAVEDPAAGPEPAGRRNEDRVGPECTASWKSQHASIFANNLYPFLRKEL